MTPSLVAFRVAHNDRVAAQRFAALKLAVERTAAGPDGRERICDGRSLQQNYAGPSFSDEDWQRITGNYVTVSGYSFMVYCREQAGYTIQAYPFGGRGAGTHPLCTDETGHVLSGMVWNRSRHVCVASSG